MYKSRLLPLPVLILSALNAYAANTPNPLNQIDKNVPNQFDKDFRDNLDQIHSVEIQKREQSAWDLQKKQDNDTVAQEVPSENNTDLLLLRRQAVLFGEGTQRTLQNRYRAVNQTATAASWQQLAQALQGAQVVGSADAGIHAVE